MIDIGRQSPSGWIRRSTVFAAIAFLISIVIDLFWSITFSTMTLSIPISIIVLLILSFFSGLWDRRLGVMPRIHAVATSTVAPFIATTALVWTLVLLKAWEP